MNDEFLRPRLVGRRFDEHTLPLDILKDFSALEELLIEVAKRQYLAAHLDRKRTPKGFTKGLELHLTAMENGSSVLVIALVYATLFLPADAIYFVQAREKIVNAIADAEHGRQPSLHPDLLRYFDRFGRGLHEGESMSFVRENGQTAVLTPATRERLLRASQAEAWTEEVTLKGRIPEIDQADNTFELELRDGTKLKSPLLETHLNVILEAAVDYRNGATVTIKGVIQKDRADRLKCFESIEHVTLLDSLDIETRMEELAQLEDGWMDGKGLALDRTSLGRLVQAFDECFDRDLPLPYIYPTLDNGVQAEWTLGRWEVSLEIAFPGLTAEYQAVHLDTDETREEILTLANENRRDWEILNGVLGQLQESQA